MCEHIHICTNFCSYFAARLDDYDSILSLSGPDLERMTQLSSTDVSVLKQAVAKAVHRVPPVTGVWIVYCCGVPL